MMIIIQSTSTFYLCSAREWLEICERPDLIQRLDDAKVNIHNYYVCESHFENQIMEFATRKILIRTAIPVPVGAAQFDPHSLLDLGNDFLTDEPNFDHIDLDGDDDDLTGSIGISHKSVAMKFHS